RDFQSIVPPVPRELRARVSLLRERFLRMWPWERLLAACDRDKCLRPLSGRLTVSRSRQVGAGERVKQESRARFSGRQKYWSAVAERSGDTVFGLVGVASAYELSGLMPSHKPPPPSPQTHGSSHPSRPSTHPRPKRRGSPRTRARPG